MKIVWLRSALQDMVELAEYIAADNPDAAAEQFLKIEMGVNSLPDNPNKGRPSSFPGLRELVITGTPFVVPYRVHRGQIEILAVFHGALDWQRRLQQRKDSHKA